MRQWSLYPSTTPRPRRLVVAASGSVRLTERMLNLFLRAFLPGASRGGNSDACTSGGDGGVRGGPRPSSAWSPDSSWFHRARGTRLSTDASVESRVPRALWNQLESGLQADEGRTAPARAGRSARTRPGP